MYRQWLRTAKPEINCIYLTPPKRESNSINHATAHTRAVVFHAEKTYNSTKIKFYNVFLSHNMIFNE
jgi:hypothetical protein